jgi:hypothetical protein
MADEQLSTRDLAGTSDEEGDAAQGPERERIDASGHNPDALEQTTSADEVGGADDELEASSTAESGAGCDQRGGR